MELPSAPAQWLEDLSEDWVDQPTLPTRPFTALETRCDGNISSISHFKPTLPLAHDGATSLPTNPAAGNLLLESQMAWPLSSLSRSNKLGRGLRHSNNLCPTVAQSNRGCDRENMKTGTPQSREPSSAGLSDHTDQGSRADRVDYARSFDSEPFREEGSVLHHSVPQKQSSIGLSRAGHSPPWRRRLLEGDRVYGDRRDLFSPHALENIFQRPPNEAPSIPEGLSIFKVLHHSRRKSTTGPPGKDTFRPIPPSPSPDASHVSGVQTQLVPLTGLNEANLMIPKSSLFSQGSECNSSSHCVSSSSSQHFNTPYTHPVEGNSSNTIALPTSPPSLHSSDVSFSEVPVVGIRAGKRTISGLHYRALSNASAVALTSAKRDKSARNCSGNAGLKQRAPLGRSVTFSPDYMDQSIKKTHAQSLDEETDPCSFLKSSNGSAPGCSGFNSSNLGLPAYISDTILEGTPDSIAPGLGEIASSTTQLSSSFFTSHRVGLSTSVPILVNVSAASTASQQNCAALPSASSQTCPSGDLLSSSHLSASSSPSAVFGVGELDQHTFEMRERPSLDSTQSLTNYGASTLPAVGLRNKCGVPTTAETVASEISANPRYTSKAPGTVVLPDDQTLPLHTVSGTCETSAFEGVNINTPNTTSNLSSLMSRSPSPTAVPPGSRAPARYRVTTGHIASSSNTQQVASKHPVSVPSAVVAGSVHEDLAPEFPASTNLSSPAPLALDRDVVSKIPESDSGHRLDHSRVKALLSSVQPGSLYDGRGKVPGHAAPTSPKPKANSTELFPLTRKHIRYDSRPEGGMPLSISPSTVPSTASPAKASLPKRRRTHFKSQRDSVTFACPASYVALHGAGTGSRQSSISVSSIVCGHSRASSGIKKVAGQKRKDARHVYSNATRADDQVLRQRAITHPGRVISPRARKLKPASAGNFTASSAMFSPNCADVPSFLAKSEMNLNNSSGGLLPGLHSPNQAHFGLKLEELRPTIDALTSTIARLNVTDESTRSEETGYRQLHSRKEVGTACKNVFDANRDFIASIPEASPRKRSFTTQDFLAEAVKIMDFIRQRNGEQKGEALGEITEECENAEMKLFSGPRGEPDCDSRERDGHDAGGTLEQFLKRSSQLLPASVLRDTSSTSSLASLPPIATSSRTDFLALPNRPGSSREFIRGSNSQSPCLPTQVEIGTRFSTITSTASRKSDNCNVATLAPEAVAHLIPPAIGGMIYDGEKKTWLLADHQHKSATNVVDTCDTSESHPSIQIQRDYPQEEPEGWTLDRIPDLSVDESRERIFLHGSSAAKTIPPQANIQLPPCPLQRATTENETSHQESTHSPHSNHSTYTHRSPKPVVRQLHKRSPVGNQKISQSPALNTASQFRAPDLDDLSNFLLSEMPDFTVHQEDDLLRPLRQVVAHGGQIRLESRFLRSTGALIRALQDSSTDDFNGWTTLESVTLRNKGLESLSLLKEFCPSLTRLDVSGNRLRHVLDIGPSVRALDVSFNLLNRLTYWGGLLHLQFLDLSHNELDSLSGLSGLVHLRELIADDNLIQSFRGLDILDGLQRVSLRRNRIIEADFATARLDRLVELDISSNGTCRVSGLHRLPQLTVLSAEHNELDDSSWDNVEDCPGVPSVYGSHHSPHVSRSLAILRLSGNRLSRPASLIRIFPNLQRLYLDGNRLPAGADFSGFARLERVSLRNQKGRRGIGAVSQKKHNSGPLESESPCFPLFQTSTLRELFLSRNHLKSVPHFNLPLFQLIDLELSFCGLQTLPSEFSLLLPSLQKLNLNFNALPDIAPLAGLRRLETLLVAGNRVHRLRRCATIVSKLPALRVLDFRDNPITVGLYPPVTTEAENEVHLEARDWPSKVHSADVPIRNFGSKLQRPSTDFLGLDESLVGSDGVGEKLNCTCDVKDLMRSVDRMIPAAACRWTPDPYVGDNWYCESVRGRAQLPEIDPLNIDSSKAHTCFRYYHWQDTAQLTPPDKVRSGEAQICADESYLEIMDSHTQLRRAVYHIMMSASCPSLRRLDGRTFGRDRVWRGIEISTSDPNSRETFNRSLKHQEEWELPKVWQKLVELGVIMPVDGKP